MGTELDRWLVVEEPAQDAKPPAVTDRIGRFWNWYRTGLGQAALTGVLVAIIVANVAGGSSASKTSAALTHSTATPTATARATALPQSTKIVLHVKGNGTRSTAAFTVKNTWDLRFSCSGVPIGSGGSAPLYISVNVPYMTLPTDEVTFDCPEGASGGHDVSTFHQSGTFYLKILSGTKWDITVVDVPN